MGRFMVLPYRQGSQGAKALALALGGRVLLLQGSKFASRPDDIVINWGNTGDNTDSTIGDWGGMLNKAHTLKAATNKLNFFNRMKERAPDVIPDYWTHSSQIPDDAFPIVCRTVLAGHSGDGIVIASSRDDLVPAPLYVRYVKKQEEYRIHVGMKSGEASIISIQRKARRKETPDDQVDWQVRNHKNGFVYVRGGVNPPAAVLDVARRALEASGLDFGAVDVIWNRNQERAYVLEINTAPGLEGTTVTDYADFFRSR